MSPARKRVGTVILILALATLLIALCQRSPESPVYQGRTLEYWRQQDFFKFREAALALGTNAVPYLLSELSASDPVIRRLPQYLLARFISVGEVFTTAKGRRFDASCALISLETNAVPAILDAVFASSAKSRDQDFHFQCAQILARARSPEAKAMKTPVLLQALRSEDEEARRRAFFIFTYGENASPEISAEMVRLVDDPSPGVQDAVRQFFQMWPPNRKGTEL
jgi:hypothetical protein